MTNLNNILNKYGNTNPSYNFDKKDRPFLNLVDLKLADEGVRYPIQALFINTSGKFGPQGVIVTEDAQVNLPKHLTDLVKELRQDQEVTDAINARQLAFEVYSYTSDAGHVGYSINLTTADAPSSNSKGRAFDNNDTPAF